MELNLNCPSVLRAVQISDYNCLLFNIFPVITVGIVHLKQAKKLFTGITYVRALSIFLYCICILYVLILSGIVNLINLRRHEHALENFSFFL